MSLLKCSNANNCIKTVGGVAFLNLCTSPDGATFCTKFHENISKCFRLLKGHDISY